MKIQPLPRSSVSARVEELGSTARSENRIAASTGAFARLEHSDTRLTSVFWLAVTVFGALECWINRFVMNTDGISYLDVASEFASHHWLEGVNAYWSPLYPFLLSLGMRVLPTSSYWQFPAVHFVNFVIFLASAATFQFCLSRLLLYRHEVIFRGSAKLAGIPDWAIRAVGYALFLWISLQLTPIAVVSPDMMVATIIYLASGLTLGVFMGINQIREYALLGLVLGLGFLAKAPVLPIAVVFLAVTSFAPVRIRSTVPRIAVAVLVMALVCLPFLGALSHLQGHLTWGESAKLNYAWYVNGLPRYHWQGQPHIGVPVHPTHLLVQEPPVYSFDGPESATYSVWFDPVYWNAGVKSVVNVRGTLRQFLENCLEYEKTVFHEQAAVVVISVFLLGLAWRSGKVMTEIAKYWMLLIPVAAAFAMYAPVHVEPRMIAAYLVLLWLVLFAAVRLPDISGVQRAGSVALASLAVFAFLMQTASIFGEAASYSPRDLLALRSPGSNFEWQIASELHRMGLKPGDKVAWIRPATFNAKRNYEWARLGEFHIIAEVPSGQEGRFWAATSSERAQALEQIAQTGAVAFVVTDVPPGFSEGGWQKVGQSNFRAYFLHLRGN
jgi:hypothetical protein